MPVPNRNQWKQLKRLHNVPDGAVKGVNLGRELDKVDKAVERSPAVYFRALQQYLTIANTYITKLDANKVTDYPGFQKVFLDEYLGDAHKLLEKVKLEADGRKLYMSELRKFFQAVQKLDAHSTRVDLEHFSQFARGLTSVARRINNAVDPRTIRAIDRQLARIDRAEDRIGANPNEEQVENFINVAKSVAQEISEAAARQGLLEQA